MGKVWLSSPPPPPPPSEFGCADVYFAFLAGIFVYFLFIIIFMRRPKTSKSAGILKWIEIYKVKKEHYLMRQDNIQMIVLNYGTRQIKATETNK